MSAAGKLVRGQQRRVVMRSRLPRGDRRRGRMVSRQAPLLPRALRRRVWLAAEYRPGGVRWCDAQARGLGVLRHAAEERKAA